MERNFHKRWWLTSPVHQGDHGGAVKTIAQGMPCDFGGPCECACVFSFIAREAAGASSIRHSLRPLSFEGARTSSKTRALGVARTISLFENLYQQTRCRPGHRAGTHNPKCPFCAMLERQSY